MTMPKDAEPTLSTDERQTVELGLLMIKKSMDDYRDRENDLTSLERVEIY